MLINFLLRIRATTWVAPTIHFDALYGWGDPCGRPLGNYGFLASIISLYRSLFNPIQP